MGYEPDNRLGYGQPGKSVGLIKRGETSGIEGIDPDEVLDS